MKHEKLCVSIQKDILLKKASIGGSFYNKRNWPKFHFDKIELTDNTTPSYIYEDEEGNFIQLGNLKFVFDERYIEGDGIYYESLDVPKFDKFRKSTNIVIFNCSV